MKNIIFVFFFSLLINIVYAQKQVINDPNAQERPVKGFRAIVVSNAIDLFLSQGNDDAVAVSASSSEYRDHIRTEVDNGVLRIWSDENGKWWKKMGNKKMKAYISFKNIDRLEASGACDITVSGTLKSSVLSLELSGASDFKGMVEIGSFHIGLSGASDVAVTGSAKDLKVGASGASQVKGYELQVDNCDAEASGASDIKLTVNRELNARASGASGIHYKGGGVIRDIRTSGASSVSKRS